MTTPPPPTTATMRKYDSASKEGISDVTFRLPYRPSSDLAWTEVSEVSTDASGTITLDLTKKGQSARRGDQQGL